MPQFWLLFYAILQSWRPKGGAMAQCPAPGHVVIILPNLATVTCYQYHNFISFRILIHWICIQFKSHCNIALQYQNSQAE